MSDMELLIILIFCFGVGVPLVLCCLRADDPIILMLEFLAELLEDMD